ncbi:histidinol-phosphate transaminase [Arthrobacter sp. NtRootA1]|uniref:histidinol-phosphate transaminase n=1 Tax=Micrococcaceae TaxID=1268 RepID=UPI001CC66852|nr:histidinol-phosphate transaminase [Arthrobacter sp. NtRootA1]BCW05821.1 histidinol-phosphate aminotransferase [Arthrobacter sp. NtRootA1]
MQTPATENGSGPTIRAAIDGLPPYSAGRSVRDAAGEGAVLELLGLAANEGPYGPFPSAAKAALEQVAKANLYPESGFRTLRAELARMLNVDITEVAVGAGGIGLIHHLSVALLDEGTNIVLSTPTFHAYALDARKQGAKTLSTPVRADGSYDLEAMLGLINDATRIVYVCNPNNPTGGIVGRDELLQFIRDVPQYVTIVVDEAYFEYAQSQEYTDTVAESAFKRRNLVTLRTFSKAYGLAGLRVAYLVGSPEIIGAVQKVQSNYEVSSVAQAAALASLNEEAELVRRVGLNKQGRDALTNGLRDLGFEPLDSHANFVYVKVGDAKAFTKALEGEGVIVRPGNAMGDPESVRITVGTPDQVSATIAALDRVVTNAAKQSA